ncbi:hypothetical protein A7U60_g7907 [Sanghuangporus baumii]|uniref:DUF6533 domain-containing protein n=1 Tax=Sanghuangporus baumii TaxID=108892 RepID=A0A9Q5HS17_SANBA|nr:hypothetical protein A7U60_g7907 [Sanghuangporus baumii]
MSYYQTLHVLSDTSSDFAAVVKTAEIELCAKVALASLLFYYTITTTDKEIKYFWHTPSRHVSIVFFLNRHVGLVSIFISIQRTSITWIHSIADWATVLAIDYILLIRVLALLNQDIRLRSVLSILLALEASLRLAFMIVAVRAEIEEQKHLPEITACVEQSKCSQRTLETAYWIAPATFQIILLILVLYKSVDYWRSSKGFKGFHLVEVLVRDQVIYFMVTCVEWNNGGARKFEPFVPAWKYAIDQS